MDKPCPSIRSTIPTPVAVGAEKRTRYQLRRACLLISLSILCLARVAAEDFGDLATDEFQVNTWTPNDQRIPAVASDLVGNTVVVWQSLNQAEPGWGVFGQRVDSDGRLIGEEFPVTPVNEGPQDGAHVAMQNDGRFVVVWNGTTTTRPGEALQIRARRFSAKAEPKKSSLLVSEPARDMQILPRVALAPDDSMAVSWSGRNVTGNGFNILTRYLGSNDGYLSGPVQANLFDETAQRASDTTLTDAGAHVVVWQSALQDGSDWGIFGRCLEFGTGVGGAEFQVNQTSGGAQARPRVAAGTDNGFAVVWQDNTGQSSFDYRRVMVRLYDADCRPITSELQVNQSDAGIQDLPAIATDGNGVYVIVWQSFPPVFGLQGIYGRRLNGDGLFLGDEFRINRETEAYQDHPTVTGLPDGGFMTVWEVLRPGGSGFEIFARRFYGPSATRIELLEGDNQSADVEQRFSEPLVVRLLDQWGQPRANEIVQFEMPETGPSGFFINERRMLDVATNTEGQAQAEVFAGSAAGDYQVRIRISGSPLEDFFTLRNLSEAASPLPVPAGQTAAWLVLLMLMWLTGLSRRP